METVGLGALKLIPSEPPTGAMGMVPLGEITDSDYIPGARPDASFIKSVEENGVLTPVLLQYNPGDKSGYVIIDGRRRILAARANNLHEIRAVVFAPGSTPMEAATILSNAQRSENPVIELKALEALIKDGKSETEIFRATGLLPQTQRRRLNLLRLLEPLRNALAESRMALSTAEAAAKLSIPNQKRLITVLEENGKVSGRDVHLCARVAATDAAGRLSLSLFETPEEAGEMPEPDAFDNSIPGKSAPSLELIQEQLDEAMESAYTEEAAGIRADPYARGVYAALLWITGGTDNLPMAPAPEDWPEEDPEVSEAIAAGEAAAEAAVERYLEGREMNHSTGDDSREEEPDTDSFQPEAEAPADTMGARLYGIEAAIPFTMDSITRDAISKAENSGEDTPYLPETYNKYIDKEAAAERYPEGRNMNPSTDDTGDPFQE